MVSVMPTISIPLLSRVPRVDGQYADGREAYDITLPVPGAPIQTIKFGVVSYDSMMTTVLQHKARFEADQDLNMTAKTTWLHVGHVLDDLSGERTYVYQLRRPWDQAPPILNPLIDYDEI